MPRLSIIIPVLGSSARLETTLVSVLENRPPDCEVLVVLNAPYADPYDLASEIRFLPVPSGTGLIGALNEGIQASQAPIVHLLSAGLEVTDCWTEAALAHFKDPRVASVAPLVVNVLDTRTPIAAGLEYCCRRGRLVRTGAAMKAESSCVISQSQPTEILGPLAQAAFYRRSALELTGGLPQSVGAAVADADLALSLRFAGYHSVLEPRSIVMGTVGDVAPPKASFRQGLAAERLLWRAAPIAGWLKSIAAHPFGVIGEFLGALPHPGAFTSLAGRFLAVCQMGSHRAHHQWLLDVERTAAALFRGARSQRLRMDGPHDVPRATGASEARIAAHPSL